MIVDCIIPLFNKKNYISKAIESVINQKIKKFNKILIINDGSTDGGEDKVKKLLSKYSQIELIDQNNLGSSAARNRGIKSSNADYVVFLDADDQLHHKYLLSIYLMKNSYPESKVFSTKHYNVYNNLELINNSKELKLFKSNIIKLKNPIFSYSFDSKIFCSSGICIERKIMEEIKFPEGINVGEDIYTWLKVFKSNHLIYYNKELIVIFKVSENRSIDIFKETTYYLKKINEFKIFRNKTYLIYFIMSSIIYLYQNLNEKNISTNFINIVKKQSKFIYYILSILNNFILFQFYKIFKDRKIKEENLRITPNIDNFYILSTNYFFVLPGIPIIILSLYWSNNYLLISDVLLMSSLTIFVTSSISFYARPFTIISNKLREAIIFLNIKKILIFPILVLLLFFQKVMSLDGILISNISILFILYIWIVEADLIISEFEGSSRKLIKNLFEIVIFSSLMIINIFFQNKILSLITSFSILIILIIKCYKIFHKKKLHNSFLQINRLVHKNILYITINSFILNLTNFLHRYLILMFVDKSYAGILFFAFSMGSFPANLFSFVFGATIIRSKKKFPMFGIYLFGSYFILAFYIFLLDIFNVDKSIIYYFFKKTHLEFIYLSMIGGLLMSYALYQKNNIFIKYDIKKIFFPEILFSIIILLSIPIINYYFSYINFKFIFLINSIVAFLIFVPLSKYLKNE